MARIHAGEIWLHRIGDLVSGRESRRMEKAVQTLRLAAIILASKFQNI